MYLKTVCVLFLILLISCTSNLDSVPDKESDAGIEFDSTQCFELKMEQWYISFHKYQEQGMDMYEADKKAWEDAVKGFDSCRESYGMKIAAQPAPED